MDLLSSGAASSYCVKPPKKCPLLSCSGWRGSLQPIDWNHWWFPHQRGGSSQTQVLTLKELKTGFKVLHVSPTVLGSLALKCGLQCFLAVAHWKNKPAHVGCSLTRVQQSWQYVWRDDKGVRCCCRWELSCAGSAGQRRKLTLFLVSLCTCSTCWQRTERHRYYTVFLRLQSGADDYHKDPGVLGSVIQPFPCAITTC